MVGAERRKQRKISLLNPGLIIETSTLFIQAIGQDSVDEQFGFVWQISTGS